MSTKVRTSRQRNRVFFEMTNNKVNKADDTESVKEGKDATSSTGKSDDVAEKNFQRHSCK